MEKITIESKINAPTEKVWDYWTSPAHVMQWSSASDEWHAPHAENDVRVGGSFTTRMEAKDGSFGFDFGGTYDEVKKEELLSYTLTDGRKVKVEFHSEEDGVLVRETFDPEEDNPADLQRDGWQAILNNFKKHVETT